MKLIWHLAKQSWKPLVAAGLLGGLAGVTNVSLLALIHRALQRPGAAAGWLVALFAGCCLASLLTRIGSQVFLVRLSQNSISRLRFGLCQRILESPLRHLEEIGTHRMLGSLTGDVLVVAHALNGLPTLCVNVVMLLCGAVYLGILSGTVLAGAVVFTVLGIASYWVSSRRASKYIRAGASPRTCC